MSEDKEQRHSAEWLRLIEEELAWRYHGTVTQFAVTRLGVGWRAHLKVVKTGGGHVTYATGSTAESACSALFEQLQMRALEWKIDKWPVRIPGRRFRSN